MDYTLNDFAKIVSDLARNASSEGTFGVGGILISDSGAVIKTMENHVIENNLIHDPTAHVERQIVDWYFESIAQGVSLPSPDKMTIISSLDPCMMCAGSILTAGIVGIRTTMSACGAVQDVPELSR